MVTNKHTLIGLLRLRKCSEEKAFRPELKPKLLKDTSPSYNSCDPTLLAGVSMVRELHVYGSVVPIHAKDPLKFQHQGIGTLLMEEAERISRLEHGSYKIAVISGVGTRNYYRKLGYHLDGVYMSKILD
ncbi:unnamed protein product [Gordionus sp. m RMFG-2023]